MPERSKGFTLLEVVVALAILAVASGGFITVFGHHISTIRHLEDTTFATIIGNNALTEMYVLKQWPAVGAWEQQVQMAGHTWHLSLEASDTESPNMHRVTVNVSKNEGNNNIITAVGFMGRN